MNAGPTVSLAEAARHSPRSVTTLRRWLAAGTIAGAKRNAVTSIWEIPIASLVEAGAWPTSTPQGPHIDPDPPDADLEDGAGELLAQIEALYAVVDQSDANTREALAAVDVERRLREAAERNCDDLRTALRMLEAHDL